MSSEYLSKLERDISGGVLHLMILVQIERLGPIHGYGLIKAMAEALGRDAFKEGTVYPILNDLERSGIIRGRWGQGTSGPPRKYYEMTPAGRATMKQAVREWERVRKGLDTILNNGFRSGKA